MDRKLTKQKGFNLIELMIGVAIVGILAAIAQNMYSDYLIRIQVIEGFVISAPVREEMVSYHNENGVWPNNNNLASLANQNQIEGQYVRSVALNQHRIEIQYGEDAHPEIWGEKVQLEPTLVNGIFTWRCIVTGGGVEEKYLPSICGDSNNRGNRGNGNNN